MRWIARRPGSWLACVAAVALLAGCGAPAVTATATPSTATAPPATPSATGPVAPDNLSASAARAAARADIAAAAQPGAGLQKLNQGPAAPLRMPVAVVVGNDPGARPQSGIARADVVWEISAEGFITRYLAIFATQGADQIGPIRSTRIYFDQLARAYDIPLVHAGGNVDALAYIPTWHIKNLDDIYGAGGYFWRGPDRVPPDNLYTSSRLVNAAVIANRFANQALLLPEHGAAPAGGTPTRSVAFDYMRSAAYTYVSGWRWQGGWWYRTINGRASLTRGGTPVRAGSIIILVARQAPDPDPHTPGALKILWQDGGTAWVLRGGQRWPGTWRLGGKGLPVVRAGGRILDVGARMPYWYEVVPSAQAVAFGG